MGNASWILIVVIGAVAGVFYLYRRGKIPWLKGIKMPKLPKMFEPKAETQIERLKAEAEKEVAKAGELQSVLEAKRELAKARAANIKLRKEIDGVSEKSVEKEKRDEIKAQEAQKVKPRRL